MRGTHWLAGLVLLAFLIPQHAVAQRRDPLTDAEVDQMREAADYPNKRLELMSGFARARLAAIDQLRAEKQPPKDRPKQIHDQLQDFTSLLDEIGDNVEVYASHKTDMRKGLSVLIGATSEWQLKLRNLKEQSPADELDQYSFVLVSATEAVKDTADDARTQLQTQNELAKDKKLNKIYSERPD
jgi:hypothetical protein